MTVCRDIASIVTDLEGLATDDDLAAVAVIAVRKNGYIKEMVHWGEGTRFILLAGLQVTLHNVTRMISEDP